MTLLTEAALELAICQIREHQEVRGELVCYKPTKLLVLQEFRNMAYLILNPWVLKRKVYLKRRKRK